MGCGGGTAELKSRQSAVILLLIKVIFDGVDKREN